MICMCDIYVCMKKRRLTMQEMPPLFVLFSFVFVGVERPGVWLSLNAVHY